MANMQKLFEQEGWSLHCNFCGKDVFKDPLDYYMLKDEVWAKICDNDYVSPTHILCKGCAEKILGRNFTAEDMKDAPVNYYYPNSGDPILKILMEY